jgi:predicted enzyme related to lactoylglutathione lyase
MVDSLVGRVAGISYLHLPARNIAVSAAFYRDAFGWRLSGAPENPSFSDGTGHVIGRWVTDQAVVGDAGQRAYIYVANVDDTLADFSPRLSRGSLLLAPRLNPPPRSPTHSYWPRTPEIWRTKRPSLRWQTQSKTRTSLPRCRPSRRSTC